MPRTIQSILDEIGTILPDGVRAWVDPQGTDNIIVGNDVLGFCVTRKHIDDNQHMQFVKETLPNWEFAIWQAKNLPIPQQS